MLTKLAAANVKKQLGNYVIYFITVSLTVALMFAVNNVIYSKEMLTKASDVSEIKTGLTALSVILSLIVAFVLGYAFFASPLWARGYCSACSFIKH